MMLDRRQATTGMAVPTIPLMTIFVMIFIGTWEQWLCDLLQLLGVFSNSIMQKSYVQLRPTRYSWRTNMAFSSASQSVPCNHSDLSLLISSRDLWNVKFWCFRTLWSNSVCWRIFGVVTVKKSLHMIDIASPAHCKLFWSSTDTVISVVRIWFLALVNREKLP